MNRKGFTLIELIVTIALLAVVSIISFVSITGIINDSKEKDCNNLVKSIKSATKDYISDNRYTDELYMPDGRIKKEFNTSNISKYLNGDLVNPYDNKTINDDIIIRVEYNSDNTPKNILVCYNDRDNDCDNDREIKCNKGKLY